MRKLTGVLLILSGLQCTVQAYSGFFALKVAGDPSFSLMTRLGKCKIYGGRNRTVLYREKIWKIGRLREGRQSVGRSCETGNDTVEVLYKGQLQQ